MAELDALHAAADETDQPNGHLFAYLRSLTESGLAEPAWCEALSAEHRLQAAPNLIYPVGDSLFVHIYTQPGSAPQYRMIEPDYGHDLSTLLPQIERRMSDAAAQVTALDDEEDVSKVLLTALDACTTTNPPAQTWQDRLLAAVRPNRLFISRQQRAALQYRLVRDKVGVGTLQPFLQDPHLEDISCSGVGHLFVVHKHFGNLQTDTSFTTEEELDQFMISLADKMRRPLTLKDPILDGALPDGSRINIVFGTKVSTRGSNFSVRLLPKQPLTLLDLMLNGSVTPQILAYLSMLMGEGLNLFVAGEAASGKTTLLNALTGFFPLEDRLVTVEDTPELRLAHGNWIAEVAQTDVKGDGVTLFRLVKSALRQRPNAILIGEIRGEEGPIAFQAMQTGHVCLSTIHGATAQNVLQRLVHFPIEVPRENLENLHAIVLLSDVRLPNGQRGRRVVSLVEHYGYDYEAGQFQCHELFRWDPITDDFTLLLPSKHLEERVAQRRGLPTGQESTIYAELERRTQFLTQLKAQGVSNYAEYLDRLARAHRAGIFR